jgi:hypothetical protein
VPLTASGLHALRDEYTRTIEPDYALAAETLTLERTLSDLVNQAYALTQADIALIWQIAPPRKPIPPPATGSGPLYIIIPGCRISLGSAFSFAARWPHCC